MQIPVEAVLSFPTNYLKPEVLIPGGFIGRRISQESTIALIIISWLESDIHFLGIYSLFPLLLLVFLDNDLTILQIHLSPSVMVMCYFL